MTFAAVGLGLALISKLSAIFLFIVLPLLYAIAWRRKRGRPFFTVRGAILTLLFTVSGVALCIALAYGPAALARAHLAWMMRGQRSASIWTSLRWILSEMRSGLSPGSFRYIQGLEELHKHNSEGNQAYLLGRLSNSGWWLYFPIVFLVKTPTGVLLGCLLAIAGLFYFRIGTAPILPLACVVLTPAIYFLLAMSSSIDLGVRYILPVYPFLYVLISFLLIRYGPDLLGRSWPSVIAALVLMTSVESLLSYPHYLAFFNWPSGGAQNGARYLLD